MTLSRRFGAFVVLLTVFITGCSTISEGRKIDYKSTRTLPPLEVPPDLTTLPAEQGLPAPATVATTTAAPAPQAAAASNAVLPQFSNVRIEREGQLRWVVVSATPDQVWSRLREFVLANGLLIARENAKTGVIETEWAENRAKVGTGMQTLLAKWLGSLYSTGTRDRFRIRVDRGLAPGTVEIYVSHQGMEEVITQAGTGGVGEATKWQPRASDPHLEAEMLKLVMMQFGSSEGQARTAVAASETPKPAPERAKLTRAGAAPLLSLPESLEQAWRRVGLTLDRGGFTVEDRNRSQWTYFIRYVDPDKKSKLASEDEYQLRLKAADPGTVVEVLDRSGALVTTGPGERILGLLHEQLK